ncbi:MAG TPA: BtaA family protein [Pirellulaceae bacterium]|nr:BtaA family protein [Pirellulaceae bacterium]
MVLTDWISGRVFNAVHRNNLVYNTCWEDPRLDREALQFGADDHVMVITSAGCNALDYALCGPSSVSAVDMNPRQNALLQLKIAGIRRLDYDQFFKLFGDGRLPGVRKVYETKLRQDLCDWSRAFWDRKIRFFDNPRKTFYYRGTSGAFARLMRIYVEKVIKVRPAIDRLLDAPSVDEQLRIYEADLRDKFWTGLVKFAMNRDTTLSMLGVPKAQRKQIELTYEGGVVKFVRDCVEAVFTKLPLRDNYFWRVYLNGCYTRECCPEYLTAAGFERLKGGLVDRVRTHTCSVQAFLEKSELPISKFILLDHMDWLSDKFFPLLEAEWQAIVDRAAPNSRIIWRSGGLRTDFIDQVQVRRGEKLVKINQMLTYHPELAARLHPLDRVHTYGSFYIADLKK